MCRRIRDTYSDSFPDLNLTRPLSGPFLLDTEMTDEQVALLEKRIAELEKQVKALERGVVYIPAENE